MSGGFFSKQKWLLVEKKTYLASCLQMLKCCLAQAWQSSL